MNFQINFKIFNFQYLTNLEFLNFEKRSLEFSILNIENQDLNLEFSTLIFKFWIFNIWQAKSWIFNLCKPLICSIWEAKSWVSKSYCKLSTFGNPNLKFSNLFRIWHVFNIWHTKYANLEFSIFDRRNLKCPIFGKLNLEFSIYGKPDLEHSISCKKNPKSWKLWIPDLEFWKLAFPNLNFLILGRPNLEFSIYLV